MNLNIDVTERRTSADVVFEQLQGEIVSNALPPGTKISEVDVANRFGTHGVGSASGSSSPEQSPCHVVHAGSAPSGACPARRVCRRSTPDLRLELLEAPLQSALGDLQRPPERDALAFRYESAQETLHEEAPFECVVCGRPFATRSVVERMTEKLQGHRMFQGEALRRLQMCEDCRVKDVYANDAEPL